MILPRADEHITGILELMQAILESGGTSKEVRYETPPMSDTTAAATPKIPQGSAIAARGRYCCLLLLLASAFFCDPCGQQPGQGAFPKDSPIITNNYFCP